MEIKVLHVVPVGDLIEHDLDELCVCGPTPGPQDRCFGGMSWVFTHHSLDGRERHEQPPDPADAPGG